jgi:ribosomal protein S18 acetylase RimI-like enzyme
MKINIRPAQKNDISAIQKFARSLNQTREKQFSASNKPFHKRKKSASLPTLKDVLLVAESEGNIVGYIWGSIHERKNHALSKLGYIDELYVDNNSRGQNVGQSLMKAIIKVFKQKGCNHVTTLTDTENKKAQDFYKSCGMKEVTVELWKKIS